jgi:hypothetical protein
MAREICRQFIPFPPCGFHQPYTGTKQTFSFWDQREGKSFNKKTPPLLVTIILIKKQNQYETRAITA